MQEICIESEVKGIKALPPEWEHDPRIIRILLKTVDLIIKEEQITKC